MTFAHSFIQFFELKFAVPLLMNVESLMLSPSLLSERLIESP